MAEIYSGGLLSRTTFLSCIKLVFRFIKGFYKNYFDPHTFEERLDISQMHLPPEYSSITVLMDCVHNPIVSPASENSMKYFSYKLKGSALNTLVCINLILYTLIVY